ncbi:MAG: pilus assembly protein PilM [Sedimentisphaerales bacterium]|nr:pilus assembly protein PilM [Sedimentisphaerales bacterium]
MPGFMSKKYLPIGLDIGSTAVRAIQLLHQGGKLHVYSALELVPENDPQQLPIDLSDGDRDDEIVELVQKLHEQGGFRGRDVILHCPADKMDLRLIELPGRVDELPREAILGAIRLRIGGQTSLPFEQVVIDYFCVNNNRQDHVQVMAVTADGRWIKNRIHLVKAAGLICVAIDAFAFTQDRIVANYQKSINHPGYLKKNDDSQICDLQNGRDEIEANDNDNSRTDRDKNDSAGPTPEDLVAVLDIGYAGSTLVVRNNEGPIFCRRFSFGGRKLTDLLTERLMVNYPQAEKIKCTFGFDSQVRQLCSVTNSVSTRIRQNHDLDTDIDNDPNAIIPGQADSDSELAKVVYAALQNELNDYVEAIIRSLNYVISCPGNSRLSEICLCGSGAHLKNLDSYLHDRFGLPVSIYSNVILDEIIPYLPPSQSGSGKWATVLGLALAGEGK